MMIKFSKFICAVATALALLVPQIALAANNNNGSANGSAGKTDTCATLKQQFDNANGSNVIANIPQYCRIEFVYQKFINTALYFIGIVAVIAVIYGGYLYMTAGGNAAQVKKGRSVLTWAIIGLVVVLAAAVIVNVVVNLLVENKFV